MMGAIAREATMADQGRTGTYLDSRGVEMGRMTFAEALEVIHGLAEGNQLRDEQVGREQALIEIRDWQQSAIDTLHDLVVNHADTLDALPYPNQAGQWPDGVLEASRDMDPTLPANAVRICLDLAVQGALDPSAAERYPLIADIVDRQYQAIDVTGDLLGMHAGALEGIVVLDTSGILRP